MAACADFKALGQIAKLSGSFALSGLVAHSLILKRADAYFSPVYVPLLEQPYPVRRQSGKVIKDFRAKELGEADVTYPVSELLKSPWAAFTLTAMGWALLKSLAINAAVFLHIWMMHLQENEDRREQAMAEGANEDELPLELPEISRRDIEHIVRGGVRGGARETACTFVRRHLERLCTARLDDRTAWKLLKDHSVSAVRKVRKHGAAATVLLTVRTTTRSMLLAQAADFIVSSGLDSWRLFVSPHLPWLWVRLRRRQLQARERREVLDNGEPVQLQEQQQQLKEDAAVAARKERELPPLAVRGKQLGKRVAGNAARSSISLVATAAGAGLVSGVYPGALVLLAGNATDMVVSLFVTGPELNEWYERNRVPKLTICLAVASTGLAVYFLAQGSSKAKIYVPTPAVQ